MKPVKSDVHFPALEESTLSRWKKNGIIEKALSANQDKKRFVFYDGPPFATGLPHYGHILAGTLKDIVPRYWAMKGYYVERRWGWDCHGLPVEFEMENQLGLSGRQDVEKMGWASLTRPVGELCSVIPKSGSGLSNARVGGPILEIAIEPWTPSSWSRFGGFFVNFGTWVSSMRAIG